MGLILRDFECRKCKRIFEALVESTGFGPPVEIASCTCGGEGKRIFSFRGLIKVASESDLPPLLARDSGLTKEVSPGKSLNRPWEQEREHSKIHYVEKKLPDGRIVRRPSVKLDQPKSRGLNQNLEQDIGRAASKRRS